MAERCPFDIGKVNSEHAAADAYANWRQDGSVVFAAAFGGYHAVFSYDAVRSCAADPTRLVSGEGATTPVLSTVRAVPTELDPPEHKSHRKLLQAPLRPDRVSEWTGRIAEVTDQVIDEFAELGKADLRQIAQVVPPTIIAEMLGFPEESGNMVIQSDMLNRAAHSPDPAVRSTAGGAFTNYVEGLVAQAEAAEGRDDLLSSIVRGEVDGQPVPHETAVRTTVSLVIAGQETTVNAIGSMLWLLGAHPEAKQRLLDDPALIPKAVEEGVPGPDDGTHRS